MMKCSDSEAGLYGIYKIPFREIYTLLLYQRKWMSTFQTSNIVFFYKNSF